MLFQLKNRLRQRPLPQRIWPPPQALSDHCRANFRIFKDFSVFWPLSIHKLTFHPPPHTHLSGHCLLSIFRFGDVLKWWIYIHSRSATGPKEWRESISFFFSCIIGSLIISSLWLKKWFVFPDSYSTIKSTLLTI